MIMTCDTSDSRLKLARVTNHVATETHTDDVDVAEEEPLLKVQKSDEEGDLPAGYTGVLVGLAVSLRCPSIPVH